VIPESPEAGVDLLLSATEKLAELAKLLAGELCAAGHGVFTCLTTMLLLGKLLFSFAIRDHNPRRSL
jgi:hypothetical protein